MRHEIDLISYASSSKEEHENMIKKLLAQPFKIPMEGYSVMPSTRTLGMKRSMGKIPLFDPYAEGALVLYTPPELTEHEKLKTSESDKKVHVVVDPILSNILRPHQREGVKFMYDCVTGRMIEGFQGCIMADEMGLGKLLRNFTKFLLF
jgi:DNA repair and recombination RAD54-like protein